MEDLQLECQARSFAYSREYCGDIWPQLQMQCARCTVFLSSGEKPQRGASILNLTWRLFLVMHLDRLWTLPLFEGYGCRYELDVKSSTTKPPSLWSVLN